MLTSTALTSGSAPISRSAVTIAAGSLAVPMSRKLAGSPPSNLIASIVAMARPAPLTMQPMSPSSLT